MDLLRSDILVSRILPDEAVVDDLHEKMVPTSLFTRISYPGIDISRLMVEMATNEEIGDQVEDMVETPGEVAVVAGAEPVERSGCSIHEALLR